MSRRAFNLIDETQNLSDRELPQPVRDRTAPLAHRRQDLEQPVQDPILAEVEDLLFAVKVVVEVSR
jgi:hypothetical protein